MQYKCLASADLPVEDRNREIPAWPKQTEKPREKNKLKVNKVKLKKEERIVCVCLPEPKIENKMKYLTHTHKESYTLVARKRYMKNLLYVYNRITRDRRGNISHYKSYIISYRVRHVQILMLPVRYAKIMQITLKMFCMRNAAWLACGNCISLWNFPPLWHCTRIRIN